MTAFFLSMIIFSICYGNKEYMQDVMGREFEKNIIGQTSFMAAGFGLLLTLDYGLTFSIDRKEKERLEGEINRVSGKLANESFVSRAPAAVVDQERAKLVKYEEMHKSIVDRIAILSK